MYARKNRKMHQQVHNLLICFSRFFPFFGSQKKLDPGKSLEHIQISRAGANKVSTNVHESDTNP
jgi:hypothetical protein